MHTPKTHLVLKAETLLSWPVLVIHPVAGDSLLTLPMHSKVSSELMGATSLLRLMLLSPVASGVMQRAFVPQMRNRGHLV